MKNFKRILSYLMTIVVGVFLFLGIKVTNVFADETFKFETDKGYLNYVVDNNEITITDYFGEDTELNIPSEINGKSVTQIGEEAFYRCINLTNIEIPNSITTIGKNAFKLCNKLTNIEVPNSVTNIGDSAFSICTSLTSIKLPNSIKNIEDFTFSYCEQLTSIEIPDSVVSIGEYAFSSCHSLTSIEIPNSVKTIKNSAFSSCDKLINVEISDSVTDIEKFAFAWCKSLTEIEIPNSVTNIGDSAFTCCTNLKSVEISNSVVDIETGAFLNCISLKRINVAKNNKNYIDEDGILFNKDKSTLVIYPSGRTEESYKIPNSVKKVEHLAFNFCSALNSIEVPASVTIVESSSFAFCSNLTEINVDKNNTNYIDEDGILFNNDKSVLVTYPLGKKEESYKIPDSVTSIGEGAFYENTNLINIEIPDSVTSIGESAFYSNINLTNIEIPDSVKNIEDFAFSYCTSLKNIKIPNLITSIEEYTFDSCDSLESVELPNSIITIGDYAFNRCNNLKSINLPNSITSIGKYAFYDCDSLESIEIPNSVTNIEKSAFNHCNNLTICGYKNSYAKTYAKENSIRFQEIKPNIEINSFVADKVSPQNIQTSVKLTTKINGTDGIVQYKYYRYLNGNYAVIKEWSITNNVIIAPKNPGIYDIYVAVKDSEGNIVRKNLKFEFVKPLKIESFKADKISPQKIQTKVKLTTSAIGEGILQYKYYRYLNGKYALIKDWSTSNNITIAPKTKGTYDIYVGVKDKTGNIVRKNIKFTFN